MAVDPNAPAQLNKDDVVIALIRKAGFDEADERIYIGIVSGTTDATILAAQKAAEDKALSDARALIAKSEADAKANADAAKAQADAAKAAADAQAAADKAAADAAEAAEPDNNAPGSAG